MLESWLCGQDHVTSTLEMHSQKDLYPIMKNRCLWLEVKFSGVHLLFLSYSLLKILFALVDLYTREELIPYYLECMITTGSY